MNSKKKLIQMLGIENPIIQAPMAGVAANAELVAAVSNSGGLGSLGAAYMPPEDIRKTIIQIRELTDKPFAVNLFIPETSPKTSNVSMNEMRETCNFIEKASSELKIKIEPVTPPYSQPFEEQMAVILEEKIPVFSFIFGLLPKKWIDQLKEKSLLIGTATNVAEAILLEQAGIDMIVAQGSEAGGHHGTFIGKTEDSLIGLMSLIPQMIENIKIPVIAAGGIMTSKSILASLLLGASAVQLGTAFLTCKESKIHPKYKEALLATPADNTVLTKAFSGRLARGIKNKFIEIFSEHPDKILPFPIQNAVTRPMRNEAAKQNCPDFMSLWAGQSAFLCKETSVAELMQELIHELSQFKH